MDWRARWQGMMLVALSVCSTAAQDPPGDAVATDSLPARLTAQAQKLSEAQPPAAPPSKPKPRVKPEAANFKGVQPGRTTRQQLTELWGVPREVKRSGESIEQVYQLATFKSLVVTIKADFVSSIVVNLEQPLAPSVLAGQLQINDVDPVTVADRRGTPLGQAYPERGVLFGYDPALVAPHVAQIVIEPLDIQSFLLRAQTRMRDQWTNALADVQAAQQIDEANPAVHALRARLLLTMGRADEAFKANEQALAATPDNLAAMEVHVRILLDLMDYDTAERLAQNLLQHAKGDRLVQAQAEAAIGNCLAGRAGADPAAAMRHHLRAKQLAELLAEDEQTAVRQAAKRLLLEIHLAIAQDVAAGHWKNKTETVAKWLDHADTLASDLISHEQASEEVMLRVCEQALAVLADGNEPAGAEVWIDRALSRGKKLVAGATDPACQQSLRWRLGLAMHDAARLQQALHHADQAIELAESALEHLKAAPVVAESRPAHDFLMGRTYYRFGALYAIERQDHKRAVSYYDKAISLLESPVPRCAQADEGRQGETFVSMGVSYWALTGRQEAIRLTKQGARLMEHAADDGLLDRSALAVPYGNLANMHKTLGDTRGADEFSRLATACQKRAAK